MLKVSEVVHQDMQLLNFTQRAIRPCPATVFILQHATRIPQWRINNFLKRLMRRVKEETLYLLPLWKPPSVRLAPPSALPGCRLAGLSRYIYCIDIASSALHIPSVSHLQRFGGFSCIIPSRPHSQSLLFPSRRWDMIPLMARRHCSGIRYRDSG